MISMSLSDGGSASENVLDFLELGDVDISVSVEIEHLECHLEMTGRRRQHRQQE